MVIRWWLDTRGLAGLSDHRQWAKLLFMVQAIIVAAGQGKRMSSSGVDKLFLSVAGKPLIAHTWEKFERAACIDSLVLVARESNHQKLHNLAAEFGFRKPYKIVSGGAERQDSVWNGLQALDPNCQIV
ncbi:MAG: 2-C-methyl-D-erythritol 4-phosphate cytidylyltransferase, partial [Verrucomicrobiae bacterium]|nr:2-C-methyl-D-erythritol 4-phosphate cytidylyltransferase [Verrucomicrobiae bacterium]